MSAPLSRNGTLPNENHSFEGSEDVKNGEGSKKKSLILNAFVEMCEPCSCEPYQNNF